MQHAAVVLLITVGLFGGMLLFLEIGRRVGIRRRREDAEAAGEGVGALDSAVFALFGLLLAFTFSGASARFDARRELTVEEANDIGTAYLRLDLLPPAAQPALRESFRRYMDARLEIYRKLPDVAAAKRELARAIAFQNDIWRQAVAASTAKDAVPSAPILLLPALNAMIDITTTQVMATQMHPPLVVFVMLFGLALAASLLAGYGMSGSAVRRWFHMLGFAFVMAVAIYVILDIEYPRLGLIRIDAFDQALTDLRASMN